MTPLSHERQTSSFSGNDDTSGIISLNADRSLEITAGARDRYNSLVAKYGNRFDPPIQREFGATDLPNGNCILTAEGAEKWYRMILWQRRDRIDSKEGVLDKILP